MRPQSPNPQGELFQSRLEELLNPKHPLFLLSGEIEWGRFEKEFGSLYCPDFGRPGKPTRLMVGLHYLKHAFDLSDEAAVSQWVENPYWQYFCGEIYFQHQFPIDPSLMTRWRQKVKEKGMETLLEETLRTAMQMGALDRRQLEKLTIDTTVQEKAIAFPTDAKLCHKMREILVREAKREGIELRQSYRRKSKRALCWQSRYAAARQMRRAKREFKKIWIYLGRVTRDLERKVAANPLWEEKFKPSLDLARRLLGQRREDKNKLYSLHAPEVECIAKGKAHKKYEFGCKVALAATIRDPWIVAIRALHGNPYDGHTLAQTISQAQRLGKFQAKEVFLDQGFRGHNYKGPALVHLLKRGFKKLKPTLRKWLKRRVVIEPVIGHEKSDCRLDRNYLRGKLGDKINAILCGAGFNFRKLLRALSFCLEFLHQKIALSFASDLSTAA